MSEINDNIIKAIEILIENKVKGVSYDRTFLSVICEVHGNGIYTIINDNQKHKVKSCVPLGDIKVGKQVWVKIPCGDFRNMHICGIK